MRKKEESRMTWPTESIMILCGAYNAFVYPDNVHRQLGTGPEAWDKIKTRRSRHRVSAPT